MTSPAPEKAAPRYPEYDRGAQKVVKATVEFDGGLRAITGKLNPKAGEEPGSEWLFFKWWS